MDEIRTVVVWFGVLCSAVPVLTQNSSGTWYLISGPEVLHAGTPTKLAVTVLADYHGKVVAEVSHGTTIVAQTGDFQGGETKVLTLPPILGPISQNTLLNLAVTAYRGGNVIFTNSTTLSFSPRKVSTFLQTDKSRYQTGDTVRVRAVCVQLDNQPYRGRVDISVRDPTGNTVDTWESTGNLGIVLQEFPLSQTSPLGQWAVTTTVNGVTDEKSFIVERYDAATRFEMSLKTPSQVLIGHDVSGSVRAIYASGQPVKGTLTISVRMAPVPHSDTSPFMETQTKQIYGSAQFLFAKNIIQSLHTSLGISSDGWLHVTASVTDSFSGLQVNKAVDVHLMRDIFQLEFHDVPPMPKPSLLMFFKLRIFRYDRKPLGSEDLSYPAVIEVTQRSAMMKDETTTLTFPVPEDGEIHDHFQLQDQVVMVSLQATFKSSETTLTVYRRYLSPSGSYLQIFPPLKTITAQIGVPLQVDLQSTFVPANLHFVISSRGQVVAAGTTNYSTFSVMPALSWSPEACVTVYSILSVGEIASDTSCLPINQHNVSLKWSGGRSVPGELLTLTVTGSQPSYQLAVVVMASQDDAPQTNLDFTDEEECHIKMLTNAELYEKRPSHVPNDGRHILMVEKYWGHWMEDSESLLWLNADVNDYLWISGNIPVPDDVTSLSAFALVMSEDRGLGFTPVPEELRVSKHFSLSLDVPSNLIRGEEIVLEVIIVNHSEHQIEVILLVGQSETYEFVFADAGDISVVNAQKLILGSQVSASALFPVKFVALGLIEISVDAASTESTDSIVRRVLVKPEGVEQYFSKNLFLELAPVKHNHSRFISFFFPPHVVPDSQRGSVVLAGDILVVSINHLDSLVQIPLGCGEQNMIHFAPSIYILQYLDQSNQDNEEIRSRALAIMAEGYGRQLSFQRDDGSFRAFKSEDHSGSTWLTAFVLKSFLQAHAYMQVNQSVLDKALTWLLKRQQPTGEFVEVGRLIHTEMQAGLDSGTVALTAYVLIALLEDQSFVDTYTEQVLLAQRYLENKVSSGGVSNYSLCLVAYALALANNPVSGTALRELERRADYKDGVMMWSSSTSLGSHDPRPPTAQIEMAAYVLLALFRRGSWVEGIAVLKWLTEKRDHLGGYGTTQATVVALQALARFASFSGANAIDLRLNISTSSSQSASLFIINSSNYLMYQWTEIEADKDVNLKIYMEGRGFAIFQMNIFYNLDSKAFSQNLQQTAEKEPFSLDVHATNEEDLDHMQLSICIKLKENQAIPHTGMAMLDVGMLSGFSLSPDLVAPIDLIRMVQIEPDKVSYYLDSVTKSEVCIRLMLFRYFKVAGVQDAVVQLYDYYDPSSILGPLPFKGPRMESFFQTTQNVLNPKRILKGFRRRNQEEVKARKATRTYNSEVLQNLNSCAFCGKDCHLCRPGLSFTWSPSSASCPTCSLLCLILGITAFFTAGL